MILKINLLPIIVLSMYKSSQHSLFSKLENEYMIEK